jgi:tetratricopeptide (TPR) repeat protein
MTAERWQVIKRIVADALEIGREQRQDFIRQSCAGDPDLQAEVQTLLRGDAAESAFLDPDRTPDRLGPYRIVREIGRGGMGTVYLAERADGQFEQQVAIKVIKRGMDTDAVLQRFYAERQILARLQHPNITRLLDGGMFDGRPYFVMEYLEGEPIAAYCRRRELTLPDRIRLFLEVCSAVEHAHRNLILHRDLKAGNILVDATGTPKLLDFGIAKLLAAEGTTEQTAVGPRALTPQAASPEQIRNEPLTTASDVYALGVLLFELLAGQPPYHVPQNSPAEMARIICVEPAPRPSSMTGESPSRQLRGDLDNIVLKALEKEPAQRYQGAAELAADLRRYLEGLPVLARPAGGLYRARKFVGRNRRSLAIAAVVVLALGAAVTEAVLEARRANRRFQEVRQMANSFLFEFHDAIAKLPGSTPARELVVNRALQYLANLEREASGDPALKRELAQAYMRVGTAQGDPHESNLGKPREARASFEKAIALFGEVARARPSEQRAMQELAEAKLHLSALLDEQQGLDAGRVLHRQVIDSLQEFGRAHVLESHTRVILALAYFGLSETDMQRHQTSEALQTRLQSIEVLHQALARDPENAEAQRWLATDHKRLAYLYLNDLHDPAKAAASLEAAMTIDERRVAQNPADTIARLDLALGQSYYSSVFRRRGDVAGAQTLLQKAIDARGAVLNADPRNIRVRCYLLGDYTRLGTLLRDARRPAEAAAAFDHGLKLAAELDPASAASPEPAGLIAALHREAGK